jgi:peptidoglycan/xylan/chitin deacetylase (PgdA/CDA1 family)
LGKVVLGVKTREKAVALSFDDGPNEPYTSEIADILEKFGARATFFVVGQNVERFPETVRRLARSGHAIGNHSYSHSIIKPLTSPDFEEELQKTQEIILKIIGQKPLLFRPPWFFRTPKMLKNAEKHGLTTITGIFGSYLEVFQPPHKFIVRDVLPKIKPGAILVFHDGYGNKGASRAATVKAVEAVVARLCKDGYKLVTMPELLALSGQKIS